MKQRNHLIAALLMAGALASPFSQAAGDGEKKGGAPQGLPAEVITAKSAAVETRIRAVGNLRANESIVLRPEQSGRIEQILFDEGQLVRAGTPLLALDAAIYNAELKQAQARVNLSQIAYSRAESLLKKRVGSEQERDSTLAQLRVDQAQQALAQTRLDKMVIKAPFTGLTGLRLVSPGDYVNVGDDLVELTDLSTMKVDFRVPEIYLADIRQAQSVDIELDAFPGQIFQGEIYAIAPSVDNRAHNIQLRARIPNPEGKLRPGLFAKISLLIDRDEQSMLIPEQAIVPQDGGFFVMRVGQGNTVEMVPVVMGQRRPGQVQIIDGLNAGDVIVTAGHLKLYPGMPVTPIFVDGSAPAVAKGE
ncbi:efflux RND transporter periplasmic adaptor subunit [Marinobacterium arenosum]|uniref:efflux RND transporter periplasmic adaptor subunit n=1 Tax=Marinobacterium arenosum TaxID=2862496 RepID=UPI001C967B04|nr:efflux RND transporter periplasmic adaptor subunit [Marinobacterium arenosum]MBY4676260.1 efflux RND transporter periplasmic adaptor subunit [Marinobacterium arenosum]